MPRRTGGFIGHRSLQAPDQTTAVNTTSGDREGGGAFTDQSDVRDAGINGFVVQDHLLVLL